MAYIENVKEVLSYNLKIPGYQRPYKWTTDNIDDLLNDIQNAIDDYKRYKDLAFFIKMMKFTILLMDNREFCP